MNLNEYVQVRLTDRGREIAGDGLGIVTYSSDLHEDARGYSRWQLWHLMQVFGSHCYNGAPQLFVDNEVRVAGEVSTWERENRNRELQERRDAEIGYMGGGG